ncbi:hypothetical protein [Rhodococcus sp. IEGM 1330]|uniref:hypothetical protein n=1 Tax=Rhodococcus sp. IEGM 1330 TaxID=3082225 RepID=UPI002954A247|nr:hypothetical protein [Rhodococcus sp. IEGM 1330]MDV8021138.1 hypothetical protein [Rhodococcus sp. IEGM 1330]
MNREDDAVPFVWASLDNAMVAGVLAGVPETMGVPDATGEYVDFRVSGVPQIGVWQGTVRVTATVWVRSAGRTAAR